MASQNFAKNLVRNWAGARRRHSVRRAKMGVESLEPRTVLTAYIVDTVDDVVLDDGFTSLREAIIASNTDAQAGDAPAGMADGDTITFDLPTGSTIELTLGELAITGDLSIDGGELDITIDALGASRIFAIDTNEEVSISSLTLTGGAAADGGAIFNDGAQLTIADAVITQNVANGPSGSGGGIFNAAGGVLTISDSEISFNVANRAGGGIEDASDAPGVTGLSLINVSLNNNNTGVAPATAAPGNGGGLHVTGRGDVLIMGGVVRDNVAAREGGGLWNSTGVMTIEGGTHIKGNVASGDAADDGGGGIFNNGGTLTVDGAYITDNQADGVSGSGGGIFSTGGRVSVDFSRIIGNSANRAGGGVEIVNGRVTFVRTNLVGNDVDGGAGDANPGNGGALHVTGVANVILYGAKVNGNSAGREGGGLWNSANGEMSVRHSYIASNTASGDAADDGGGGIFNDGGELDVRFSRIVRNVAEGASGSGGGLLSIDGPVTVIGSAIDNNTANRAGGGVEIVNGQFDFQLGRFVGNVAGPAGSASPGNGGALHVSGDSATVNIDASRVTANTAAREGGGLWNQAGSTMNVSLSRIAENRALGTAASAGGGGIFDNGGELNLFASTLFGNTSAGAGGGLFLKQGAEARIEASRFSSNEADGNGGGIFNDADLEMIASLVTQNSAGGTGGGVFTDAGAVTDLIFAAVVANDPNDLDGPGLVI